MNDQQRGKLSHNHQARKGKLPQIYAYGKGSVAGHAEYEPVAHPSDEWVVTLAGARLIDRKRTEQDKNRQPNGKRDICRVEQHG